MLSDPPSREVQSVRTGFRIVQTLQALGTATLTDLADELDLAKSTVHNYLATLEREGYVANEEGAYRLGLRFLTHGMAAKQSMGIQRVVDGTLSSLESELAHPVWWVREECGMGIFLDRSIPEAGDEIYGRIGKRSHLHTHAPGKAILAQSADEYVESIVACHGLPERTWRTTTEVDELSAELDTIRDRGFAASDGEAVLGIESIGVGFEDASGRANALGVFGHSHDFAGSHTGETISARLLDAVDSLEANLGTEAV